VGVCRARGILRARGLSDMSSGRMQRWVFVASRKSSWALRRGGSSLGVGLERCMHHEADATVLKRMQQLLPEQAPCSVDSTCHIRLGSIQMLVLEVSVIVVAGVRAPDARHLECLPLFLHIYEQ
jgi:hypothetical protein